MGGGGRGGGVGGEGRGGGVGGGGREGGKKEDEKDEVEKEDKGKVIGQDRDDIKVKVKYTKPHPFLVRHFYILSILYPFHF